MTARRGLATSAVAIAVGLCGAPAASAFNPLKPFCKVAQLGSGVVGKACSAVSSPGKLLKAGRKLVTGHVGSAVNELSGGGSGATASSATKLGLAAIGVWVAGGAAFTLHETAKLLSHSTTPQLSSTWFSSSYRRMAAIAALLTVPFLCAAAVQALLAGDLSILSRVALGYLPLALLAVSIAAPVTMLLLAATDQLCGIVSATAGHAGARFLARAGALVGVLSLFGGSAFVAFLVAALAAGGALVLWLELLMREAAVYIVVLMLPLAFAAMVWPARRIWAIRAVELLVALVLSKFAIVCVLALGGAALGHASGPTALVGGLALVIMGAFAPWAIVRLLPLTEVASGVAGSLRAANRVPVSVNPAGTDVIQGPAADWARVLTATMGRQADELGGADGEDQARAATERLREVAPATEQQLDATAEPEPQPEPTNGEPREHSPSQESPPSPSRPQTQERTPDPDPMWRAPDLSWSTITLGLEDGWPPPRPWAPADEDRPAAEDEQ